MRAFPDSALAAAIDTHAAWRPQLEQAIAEGRAGLTVSAAQDAACCDLGRWLAGEAGRAALATDPQLATIRRLHGDFHRTAGDLLAHALRGDRLGAEALLLGTYADRSARLLSALRKWRATAPA